MADRREYLRNYLIEWRKNNAAKSAAYRKTYRTKRAADPRFYRAHNLQKKYGLTIEDYERMHAAVGGQCQICRVVRPVGGYDGLVVDHDHATGKVRGLLCRLCNTSLGGFRDSILFLEAAINYLA